MPVMTNKEKWTTSEDVPNGAATPKGPNVRLAKMLLSLMLLGILAMHCDGLPQWRNSLFDSEIIKYAKSKFKQPEFKQPPYIPHFQAHLHSTMVYEWLEEFNDAYRQTLQLGSLLDWDYNTNLTAENAQRLLEYGLWRSRYLKPWRQQAKLFRANSLPDETARQIEIISKSSSNLNPERSRELMNIHRNLQRIYSAGKVSLKNGTSLSGEPDLARLMQTSRDPDVLLWAWTSWRDAVGPKMKDDYFRFVQLQNELARSGGHKDMGEVWRGEMNIKDFESLCESLYYEIQPLYKELHAYVRRKLHNYYGKEQVDDKGPLPAHLLGNMWAQEWDDIMDIVIPYPEYPLLDVTPEMFRLNFTSKTMFKLAEDFFLSLGLEPMTEEFWKKSMLEKPDDGREVACHGSSTNFFDGKDYRIRMCTQVTMEDLNTIHHEMGHIEYFMQYRHQPILFQDGANSAFHEAVGDTIQYSFLTPEHLFRVGLSKHLPSTQEEDINFLMKQALMKLPLIPFSFAIDKWRWELFRGDIQQSNANSRWWQLRNKYQGVNSPIKRTEEDFDPGAKYHIPDNTPYIRYFISSFIQVQFHRALCAEMHREKFAPLLHRCSIYDSERAGNLLKSVLSLGSSKSWEEAMHLFTGERQVSAEAILEYYQPLYQWLRYENVRNGETVGW